MAGIVLRAGAAGRGGFPGGAAVPAVMRAPCRSILCLPYLPGTKQMVVCRDVPRQGRALHRRTGVTVWHARPTAGSSTSTMTAMGWTRRTTSLHLAALALVSALAAGCAGWPGAPDALRISTQELQERLREHVPLQHGIPGIVSVDARVAAVRTLPQSNRLAAKVAFNASGPLLPQTWYGSFDLLFGLRWEPTDQTLRAQQLEVQSLRLPMVMGRSAELLEGAINALARQLAGDLVVHRLGREEAQRLERFGVQPQAITVTPEGLVIGLAREG
ncbi:hypothetical protein WG922_20480 [Ramlibacter sp. AN1015]|uniref:hypothetical protein n=1 Tax=Ramlibacter sp. AN1015 TaxID=3133428 RepID=UPI0030BE961E